ncbi:MAG: tRNA dihydrouridine synthase DusB [Bacteroidota bacterium]
MPQTFKDIIKPQSILLAPMEDVTDMAFRLICKRLGADVVFTEFVNAEGLIRNSEKTKSKMVFAEEERPFGIQLYGGLEESMENAARMAESLQPDLIDINCGCWVKNVVGQGAGASLLKDLPKMRRVIAAVVDTVKIPVTVKTRLGWDSATVNIIDIARMVEETGTQALTIHCRTRAQGHKGEPDYSWIPKVQEAVSIPIIVNGGITSPESAKEVFDQTGCYAVMVARGAIQNPWIFKEIKHYLATGDILPSPSFLDRVETLREHLRLSVELKGERLGVIEFRKYYSGYLCKYPGVAKLRMELMQYREMQPILDHIRKYLDTVPPSSNIEDGDQKAA